MEDRKVSTEISFGADIAIGGFAAGRVWPQPYTYHTLDLDELDPSMPHGEDVTADPVAEWMAAPGQEVADLDPPRQLQGLTSQADLFMAVSGGAYGGIEYDSREWYARHDGGLPNAVPEADGYRTWGVGSDADDSVGMRLRLTRLDGEGTAWLDNSTLDVTDVLWEFNPSRGAGRWYQLFQLPKLGEPIRFSFPHATNNVVARALSSDPTEWVQEVVVEPVVDPCPELNPPASWDARMRLVDTETGRNLLGPDVVRSKFAGKGGLRVLNQTLAWDTEPLQLVPGVVHDIPFPQGYRDWSFEVSGESDESSYGYAYADLDLPPARYVLSMDVGASSDERAAPHERGEWSQYGVVLGYDDPAEVEQPGRWPTQMAATPPREWPTQWSGPQVDPDSPDGTYRPTLVMDVRNGRHVRVYLFPVWNALEDEEAGTLRLRVSRMQLERGVEATPYEPYQRRGLVVWEPTEGGAGNPGYHPVPVFGEVEAEGDMNKDDPLPFYDWRTGEEAEAETYMAIDRSGALPVKPFDEYTVAEQRAAIAAVEGASLFPTHRCEAWLPTGAWCAFAVDRRDGVLLSFAEGGTAMGSVYPDGFVIVPE